MMNQTTTPGDSTHDDLRRRFLAHAAAAFDLMFHPEYQPELVSFSQREERALELSRDLAAWLLQQQVNADPLACPTAELPINCPRCRKPAVVVRSPDQRLFKRSLATQVGQVVLKRQKWRCKSCRLSFFPGGSPAEPRR